MGSVLLGQSAITVLRTGLLLTGVCALLGALLINYITKMFHKYQ